MDDKTAAEEEHKGDSAPPAIESVARGIGTAIGIVASTAAKVVGKSEVADPDPKPKEKPRKAAAKPRTATDETASKHSASRIAKKKKKRAAHRNKLKRSNTKG